MKSRALITAIALACGTAVAAPAYAADDASRSRNSTAAATDREASPSNGGVIDKTKNAIRRLGDKIRSAGNRGAHYADDQGGTRGPNTSAMGAPAADPMEDPGRRARMDEAYANWKSRQK